jgi:CheY-like chemotaxis protein
MWGRERSILLVSGERPSPGLCPGFLHGAGLRLTQAIADPDVLELARRGAFDLIILDLPTPPDVGLALCQSLKNDVATRTTPVVVVAAAEAARSARGVGVEATVGRPIVAREYHDAVGRFVRLPKRRLQRRLVNLRVSYRSDTDSGQAFTRDLSVYGAFLKTDLFPPIGTELRVAFTIPGETQPVRCQAVVRRSASIDDGRVSTPGFAIEFCGMDEADVERLGWFLEQP